MKTTTKHSHPGKKRHVHVAPKARAAQGNCRVISSADFLHNPKRAVAMAAKGMQVCIKGGKTQIIFGLRQAKARVAQRKPYGAIISARFLARGSKVTEPLKVSWIE